MSLAKKIITTALQKNLRSEAGLNALKRAVGKASLEKFPGGRLPNKTELLAVYHNLVSTKSVHKSKELEKLLARRAVRSRSGVAIVTSLVKPYPCPGQCIYCPLDERLPKSYLAEEPAAMRALLLKFDPYAQMQKRVEALEANGHPTDKIELIIKGGTWNSYPLPYQYWFVLRSFQAANEIERKRVKGEREKEKGTRDKGQGTRIKAKESEFNENSPLAALRLALKREQRRNEQARHRLIGLTLETRPDCIAEKTIWQMRELGCTRLELGVQHTNDAVLALTKRGHDLSAAERATKLLKDYGFKTDFHLMPQLPGATAEQDLAMLEEVFRRPSLRPDMIKIYPCTVVPGSELYDWFKAGKYQAYPTSELVRILKIFKRAVIPRYCRLSRLIRDIPGQYIKAGNTVTNLREVIQRELKAEGQRCPCLRCREVGHVNLATVPDLTPHLFIDEYEASGGREYFLSYEDAGRQVVFAFCRLRLIGANAPLYNAFIRELHTYGQLLPLGKRDPTAAQHRGLGKKLVAQAERIASARGAKKIAVIAGVGVRDYYRGLGYRLQKTYLVKKVLARLTGTIDTPAKSTVY